jgi:membrane-associated phospholipid phosphatase
VILKEICFVYFSHLSQTVQKNRVYFIAFGILWLLGLYFQLTVPQFRLSQVVNGINSPLTDFFMTYITYAGDGIFLAVVGVVIVIIDKKLWLVTLLCLAVPSIVTQLLKHFVFENYHRPAIMMANIPDLHYISGVYMNQFNSFPSGHTTAAFSLYTLLALITGRKHLGFLWVIIAVVVALSRVYLLQHFWQDIVAGAIVGTVTCTLIFTFFVPKFYPDASKK